MHERSEEQGPQHELAEKALRRIIHLCKARRTVAVGKTDPSSEAHNREVEALAEMALRDLGR